MNKMDTKKIIYWMPRLSSILWILILLLTSSQTIPQNAALSENLKWIIRNNQIAIAVALLLLIGWRYEHAAGVCFILLAVFNSVMVTFTDPGSKWYVIGKMLPVTLPGFIISVLFFIAYAQKVYDEMDNEGK